MDEQVREFAILLNDSKLIAKLSTGDLMAIEAKYHAAWLVKLYNRARPLKKQCSDATDSSSVDLEELAFAELIGYIKECLEQEVPGVLTLSELVKFYQCKLKEVGAEGGKTNATRLKERVLEAVPDLTAHPEGREVILASRHDTGGILTEAKRRDSDAWCLARAAHIVRKDILFGLLYIACQTRDGNLDEFFRMKINLGHHPFQTKDSCEEDKKPTC